MTARIVYSRPLKTMILGFLGFAFTTAALAIAQNMGFIEPAAAKRAMGLLIGILVIVTGNFLPKTHPLSAPGVNPAGPAAAAERFAGWTLVVVGIAYLALFAIAPLDQARKFASILGFIAMIYIAASWAWMVRGAVLGGREDSAQDQARAAEKRKLMVPLLFAFFYAFATVCTAFLFHDRRLIIEVGWWMFLGFWFVYAVLMVLLDRRRCP
jgi:hypothetical protein